MYDGLGVREVDLEHALHPAPRTESTAGLKHRRR
jgi:hypothetical protein